MAAINFRIIKFFIDTPGQYYHNENHYYLRWLAFGGLSQKTAVVDLQ